jgi:hypothetical protein
LSSLFIQDAYFFNERRIINAFGRSRLEALLYLASQPRFQHKTRFAD